MEVTDLARAFNTMAGQIEERTSELARTLQALRDNESRLESRVSERTQELETTNSHLENEIAERRRAEESLRQTEDRFRNAFDHAPIGMALVSPEGRWLQVNHALCEITGYSEQELLERTFQDITHPDDLEADLDFARRMLAGDLPSYCMEKRYLRKDGQSVWILLSVSRSHNEMGKPFLFVTQVQDISERKRAEGLIKERACLAALTADVGIALTQQGSLQGLLQRCTEAIVQHLDAAFARIWTLGPQGDVLELQASAGMYTHLDGAHARVPVGKFKIGRIAQDRKPHLTNQVIGDPGVHDQEWARREGMVAFAGHPLILGDELCGVMALFARKPLSDIDDRGLGSHREPGRPGDRAEAGGRGAGRFKRPPARRSRWVHPGGHHRHRHEGPHHGLQHRGRAHVRLCRRGNDRAADPGLDAPRSRDQCAWGGVDAGTGPPHHRHGRFP